MAIPPLSSSRAARRSNVRRRPSAAFSIASYVTPPATHYHCSSGQKMKKMQIKRRKVTPSSSSSHFIAHLRWHLTEQPCLAKDHLVHALLVVAPAYMPASRVGAVLITLAARQADLYRQPNRHRLFRQVWGVHTCGTGRGAAIDGCSILTRGCCHGRSPRQARCCRCLGSVQWHHLSRMWF